MASPTSQPSANGTSSPVPDDIMLDGGKLRELSIPSPTSHSAVDYKTFDGSWDVLSPSSSTSASSIGSPVPSSAHLSKSRSRAMKPRRYQSSYYDDEQGVWKCRNCGGTYDMPNPGSRQRREHKKACEETQSMKALQRAQEEAQARKGQAALSEKELEVASNDRNSLGERDSDDQLHRGPARSNQDTNDPGIIGARNTTPDIPEREEVNFGAPNELIHNGELQARRSDAVRQLQETQGADAHLQGGKINGQEPKHGPDGAEFDGEHDTTKASEDGHLPSQQDRPAEDHGLGDATGSSLKTEHSEEFKPATDSSTPDSSTPASNESHLNGSLTHHWNDETSPSPKTKLLDEFEQVKHCSSAASTEVHLAGTLYDRLVDLHDDAHVVVPRSASFGRTVEESARIATLNHEIDDALGKNFSRALSLDHFGVAVTGKDHVGRVSRVGRGAEAAAGKDHSRDVSPDHWVEILVGKDHGKASSLNQGVNGIGDGRIGHAPVASPAVVSRRTQPYSPRALASTREQSGSRAIASTSKQSQSDSPRARSSSRNQSDSRQGDDSFGAMVARNMGKFWMQIASVGAVAVIAWVGKNLADRQQPSGRRAPECRRSHFAVNSFYWDD